MNPLYCICNVYYQIAVSCINYVIFITIANISVLWFILLTCAQNVENVPYDKFGETETCTYVLFQMLEGNKRKLRKINVIQEMYIYTRTVQ